MDGTFALENGTSSMARVNLPVETGRVEDRTEKMQKILLFANTDWYLYNYRLSLARYLKQAGFDVHLVSPPGDYVEKIRENGFDWIEFKLSRHGMNPLSELTSLFRLLGLYRRFKPDLTLNFTIKCVQYGSLAARWAGVPTIINFITGLGTVFAEKSTISPAMIPLVEHMYKQTLKGTHIIFQNPDDIDTFLQKKLIQQDQVTLIRGSGVDTQDMAPVIKKNEKPVVTLASRMLTSKGITDFVDAARLLKSQGAYARFVLVGRPEDGSPDGICERQLQSWSDEGAIEWWGWRDEMKEVYAQTDVFCLPSYYPEGVPRVLAEAAACGLPIVTTDMPGCREIVRPNVNGLLVPAHDVDALAGALERLIMDADLRQEMGDQSRKIAVNDFSNKKVLTETISVIEEQIRKHN
jgi:glycosyltransferase involved in cell wall biosynthesis